jgi:hemerythrin-like domain-containing protein
MRMNPLLKDLHTYHHNIAISINQISKLLGELKTEACPPTECARLFNLLGSLHGDAEKRHHQNEEYIRECLLKTQAPIDQRVKDIEHDHRGFDRIAKKLKELEYSNLTQKEIVSIVEDYIKKYYNHMDIEENIFFPLAEKWLTDNQWQEIKDRWQR